MGITVNEEGGEVIKEFAVGNELVDGGAALGLDDKLICLVEVKMYLITRSTQRHQKMEYKLT
jgi:hypothetical protein